MAKKEFDPTATARRWHVRKGLRSAEILLIQQALTMYVRTYNELKARAKEQDEKETMQSRIEAAYRISKRLTQELEEINQ